MQESYSEDLASHTGPESCASVRKDRIETSDTYKTIPPIIKGTRLWNMPIWRLGQNPPPALPCGDEGELTASPP
jgi:hypothetical protein